MNSIELFQERLTQSDDFNDLLTDVVKVMKLLGELEQSDPELAMIHLREAASKIDAEYQELCKDCELDEGEQPEREELDGMLEDAISRI